MSIVECYVGHNLLTFCRCTGDVYVGRVGKFAKHLCYVEHGRSLDYEAIAHRRYVAEHRCDVGRAVGQPVDALSVCASACGVDKYYIVVLVGVFDEFAAVGGDGSYIVMAEGGGIVYDGFGNFGVHVYGRYLRRAAGCVIYIDAEAAGEVEQCVTGSYQRRMKVGEDVACTLFGRKCCREKESRAGELFGQLLARLASTLYLEYGEIGPR